MSSRRFTRRNTRSGSGSVDPFPTISGLVLRLRSDLGITLTSGKVSGWADQSGAGNNFSQATEAWQPAYTETINGIPVITFTPQDKLEIANLALASGLTIAFVFATTSTDSTAAQAANPPVTAVSDTTAGNYLGFGIDGGFPQYIHYAGGYQIVTAAGEVNTGSPTSLIVTHKESTGAITIYRNGASDGTGTITYNSANAHVRTVGCGYATVDGWDGKIGEVLVYNRDLSASEVSLLARYFRRFWGTA